MAQPKALFVIAAVLGLLELASASNYTVGSPGGGWDLKTNFSTWASAIKFKTGDNLIFSYSPSSHDVVEVTKANYDSCTASGAIKTYSTGNDVIPLTAAGKRYFICGFPGHCDGGMKVEISTTAASGSPPSAESPPPSTSPSTPTSPSPSGTNYTVGAPGGGWDLKTNFSTWASAIKFKTGDNLIFSYSPSSHDVVEVTKANYDSCTASGAIKTYATGNDVIPLTAAGKRYFICGVPGHCGGGMKVEIDTTAASGSSPSAGSPPPSTSPSTPTSPPPAGNTPSDGSAPPPPSAASRLGFGGKMVAGLGAAGMLMVLAL